MSEPKGFREVFMSESWGNRLRFVVALPLLLVISVFSLAAMRVLPDSFVTVVMEGNYNE